MLYINTNTRIICKLKNKTIYMTVLDIFIYRILYIKYKIINIFNGGVFFFSHTNNIIQLPIIHNT